VLERFLSEEADSALAASSARVGVGASIEHRGWNGVPSAGDG
jgi:hypothetical protein